MVRHVSIKKQKALDRLKKSALATKLIKKEKKPKTDKSKGSKRSLPAIVVDIDGVVVKGKLPISGAKETLRRVLSPIESQLIPFVFLSNGGGGTEGKKADTLNTVLGFESGDQTKIT